MWNPLNLLFGRNATPNVAADDASETVTGFIELCPVYGFADHHGLAEELRARDKTGIMIRLQPVDQINAPGVLILVPEPRGYDHSSKWLDHPYAHLQRLQHAAAMSSPSIMHVTFRGSAPAANLDEPIAGCRTLFIADKGYKEEGPRLKNLQVLRLS